VVLESVWGTGGIFAEPSGLTRTAFQYWRNEAFGPVYCGGRSRFLRAQIQIDQKTIFKSEQMYSILDTAYNILRMGIPLE
jgi:hypothetical protein